MHTIGEHVQFRPRNQDQVIYFQRKKRMNEHISQDSLVAVHELAYSLDGFIWSNKVQFSPSDARAKADRTLDADDLRAIPDDEPDNLS